jgi:hypothetical protein
VAIADSDCCVAEDKGEDGFGRLTMPSMFLGLFPSKSAFPGRILELSEKLREIVPCLGEPSLIEMPKIDKYVKLNINKVLHSDFIEPLFGYISIIVINKKSENFKIIMEIDKNDKKSYYPIITNNQYNIWIDLPRVLDVFYKFDEDDKDGLPITWTLDFIIKQPYNHNPYMPQGSRCR